MVYMDLVDLRAMNFTFSARTRDGELRTLENFNFISWKPFLWESEIPKE